MDKKGLLKIFPVKSPAGHWQYQRLTAVTLAPLSIWLIILLNKALHAPYAETVAWLSNPVNATAITVWTLAVIYHAALGVQVVIEDYVSAIMLRHRAIFAANLFFLVLAVAALFSIINILLIR